MRVVTELIGTTAMLMHNIRLANPDDEIAKQISAISSKRKKTEEDRKEIARLEFMGSLYIDSGMIVIPTSNIRKCFVEGAKVTKNGRNVQRALQPVALSTKLVYDGPQTVEGVVNDHSFYDQTLVNVGRNRVVRTRPRFMPPWGLRCEWELVTSLLDLSTLQSIVQQAGVIEGLGDNRTNGYGRFEATTKEV